MRKPEQLLWDAMQRNLPKSLDLQRVENLVGEGMPDVYVGCSGKWVELKAPPRIPKRASTPLLGTKYGLRPSQKNWHTKHWRGRAPTSFILIRVEKELLMLPGLYADRINEMTFDEIKGESTAQNCFNWATVSEELE